jgi:flagellar hook-length control protein FliK
MGGDLPATPGADPIGAGAEAFTTALDSACDAQAASPDALAGTPPEDTHATGSSPNLAAWLLSIGAGAPPDARTTEQADPDAGGEMPPRATGDDEDVNEAASAADTDAGEAAADLNAVVAAPVVDVVTATPIAAANVSAGDAVPDDDSADAAVARGDAATGAASREVPGSPGRSSTPDAVSTSSVPGAETDASVQNDVDRRSESGRPSNVSGAPHESVATDAAGERSARSAVAAAGTSVERPELPGPASDVKQSAGTLSTTHRQQPASASASGATAAAAPTPQDVPGASVAHAEAAPVSQPEGSRGLSPDTIASGAAPSADGRRAAEAAEARKPIDTQEATPQIAASSTVGREGGASDPSRQGNEGDTPGQHRGLEVAVARTANTAMLTLVAGPDGTLRLTPGAHVTPLAASMLPQDQTANIDEMVRTMRVLVKEQVTEATVRLRPEHFGEVTIQVRMDGKAVSAIVLTDSSQVREWLLGQEGTMRTGLSEQGLQLERLQVQRDGRQDRRDADQQQPERRRPRPRPQSESQQTFEITV